MTIGYYFLGGLDRTGRIFSEKHSSVKLFRVFLTGNGQFEDCAHVSL